MIVLLKGLVWAFINIEANYVKSKTISILCPRFVSRTYLIYHLILQAYPFSSIVHTLHYNLKIANVLTDLCMLDRRLPLAPRQKQKKQVPCDRILLSYGLYLQLFNQP